MDERHRKKEEKFVLDELKLARKHINNAFETIRRCDMRYWRGKISGICAILNTFKK